MSLARCEMEKEQQIVREHRDVRRGAETVDPQRMSTSGCGYHRTGRNEEWAYVEEQHVVEQATEESQDWCLHKMQVSCQKDP